MRLLADCGNTALKIAIRGAEGPEDVRRVGSDPAAVRAAVEGAAELRVVSSNPAMLAVLREAWGNAWGISVVGEDLPLPEVGQYPTMGHDRILAGLAAVALYGPVVVVDCGTATTLTAWRPDAERAAGVRTLGGLILPGATACAVGLQRLAPSLPLVEPGTPDAAPMQLETPGAIAAALGIGYVAMVERCLTRLQEVTGIGQVVCTGGAAERVLPEAPRVADLVFRGLAGFDALDRL
ncbi:MAG: type III pantothenate kinase [Planctomycetota bacterium]|jgi:pantothenate kinase type III|nr:type III pantothenate kinase [Planctomycetota bacterium]